MNFTPAPRFGQLDRINHVRLLLLAGTAVTWWLGESGAACGSLWSVALMFGIAAAKGLLVILDFMALRQAPVLWRRLMVGWLLALGALIVLAYALGGQP